MAYVRQAADDSELRILGGSVGQIESEINNATGALREIWAELAFLDGEGSVERAAAFRLAIGHRAHRLGALMPRLEGLLKQIREVAGEEAVRRAGQPIHFQS